MSVTFSGPVDFANVAGTDNARLAAVAMLNGDCSVPLNQFVAQHNAGVALAGMNLPNLRCSEAQEVGPLTGVLPPLASRAVAIQCHESERR